MDMEPKAPVFDYDGVIADTEPLFWKVWVQLLAPHGINLCWESYCKFGWGVTDETVLRHCWSWLSIHLFSPKWSNK